MWLKVEALVCMGFTALGALWGLVMTVHWIVTTLLFGSWVPGEAWIKSIYAIGATLGLLAVVILLGTRLGHTTSARSLHTAKIGLICGAVVAALIPEGVLPHERFDIAWDWFREVFLCVLPLLFLAHIAFLARDALFPNIFRRG